MTAEQDLLYDWVLFVPGGDDNFYQALQIPENTLLRFGDTAFLSVLMQQLCAEFYASNAKRSEMTECLMKALLIRIAETGGSGGLNSTVERRSSELCGSVCESWEGGTGAGVFFTIGFRNGVSVHSAAGF